LARTKAVKRRKAPSTSQRPHRSTPAPRERRGQGRALPILRWTQRALIPLAIPLVSILTFSLVPTVRSWALGALGYGLIPVSLWVACFAFALRYKNAWVIRFWRVWVGSSLLVALSLGILSMFHASSGVMENASLGGYWGQHLGGQPIVPGAFKLAIITLLGPLLLFPRPTARIYRRVVIKAIRAWAAILHLALGPPLKRLAAFLARYIRPLVVRPSSATSGREPRRSKLMRRASISLRKSWRSVFGVPTPKPRPASTRASSVQGKASRKRQEIRKGTGKGSGGDPQPTPHGGKSNGWKLPSLDLLSRGESRLVPQAALQQMARHIEDTLAEHNVDVAVEDIRTGPRVIRFGLVPGWVKKYREPGGARSNQGKARGRGERGSPSGHPNIPPDSMEMSRVKVQSILMREKDMALALKTPYLRLEAPVPGEALVGLEVPNPYPRRVALRSVAESPAFQELAEKGGLPVALGEDTAGTPVMSDLSDLPHLLIAGATGSGKSVCINSIVASLLLTNRPDRLRMLMVDPKRVELTPFNGIPHLMSPVIVDTEEVLVVLRAVQNEMLRRYKLMEGVGVRNIAGYNQKVRAHGRAPLPDSMPFLVVIIDELADLMMTAAYEVEQSLVRLAQLGRATGIHLILATQRPSVNVVTGLLKANVPARIAFAVASQVDSRVILDSVGAEKLLSKGDMLLLTADSPKPKRVQGTFVHDREIEKLVEFWRIQSGPPLPEIPLHEHTGSDSDEDSHGEDDLLDRARELAQRYPHISPSVLQRRLQIGYPRAMRLMELLEDEGLISGPTESARSPVGATRSRRGRQTPED